MEDSDWIIKWNKGWEDERHETRRYLRRLGDKAFFEALEKGEVNPVLLPIVLKLMSRGK